MPSSASGACASVRSTRSPTTTRCKDGRWLILSLLNEDKQWPTLARICKARGSGYRSPLRDQEGTPCESLELIKIFGQTFATRTSPNGAKVLDGNGLVFGVVGILDDIPHDKQMIENEVLVPFENDTMMTISRSDLDRRRQEGAAARPPGLGEHSDEILRGAGYDEAAIGKLRATGADRRRSRRRTCAAILTNSGQRSLGFAAAAGHGQLSQ